MLHSLVQSDDGILHFRKESLKLYFTQYIVYAIKRSRKNSKSIPLPTVITTLTNNTEFINVVNKLGHGIGCPLLMEMKTENAYNILEQQTSSGFFF